MIMTTTTKSLISLVVVAATLVAMETVDGNFQYPRYQDRLRGIVGDLDGDDVLADTKYGRLRGKRRNGEPSAGGETSVVDWFLGVPFAKPPLGRLRFKATEPPEPWTTTRDAVRNGPACPQQLRYGRLIWHMRKDEDCLYLNIYSPVPMTSEASNSSLYPVMVYIHGGSYRIGTGNSFIGAHILAQYGVVVVTINYRLEVLGFLAGNALLTGNYGLYDQIAALGWIRDCIGAFRGDPQRVTIFGNSAGGASVGLLSVSPKAKGLFQNAIVQSGSPLSFWAVHDPKTDVDKFLVDLSEKVSCDRKSAISLVECLRETPWSNLSEALVTMPRMTPCGTDLRPVLDGVIVLDQPRTLFSTGQFTGQALMTGIVDSEMTRHIGILFPPELIATEFPLDFDDGFKRESFVRIIRHVFVFKFGLDEALADLIVYKYTNWTQGFSDPIENRRQYVNLLTDLSMWSPTVELASFVARTPKPTFLYTMQLTDEVGVGEKKKPWTLNHHQLELPYIFGSPFTGVDVDDCELRDTYSDEDRNISRMMMTVWTNFAKTGNPSRGHVSQEPSFDWTEFSGDNGAALRIVSTNITTRNHHRSEFVTLWSDLLQFNNRMDKVRHHQKENPKEIQSPIIGEKMALAMLIVAVLSVSSLVAILIFVLFRRRRKRPGL